MRPVASSFPLQILLILSMYVCLVWLLLTLSLIAYKAIMLPYPPAALGCEIVAVLLMYLVQFFAVNVGKQANMTENTTALLVSVVLLLICIAGAVYFGRGQTYVMRLDMGFSFAYVAWNALAVLFAALAMQGFSSAAATAAGIDAGSARGGGGPGGMGAMSAQMVARMQQQQQAAAAAGGSASGSGPGTTGTPSDAAHIAKVR
jgi:hypothetical protein